MKNKEREREREREAQENWYGYGLFKSYLFLCIVLVIHEFDGVCFGKSENCGSTFIQNIVSCHKLSYKTLSLTLYFQTNRTLRKMPNSVYTFAFSFASWHKAIVGLFLDSFIFILLGSKDLGFYVFRTLICIVGKPWSKQCV